MHTMGGGRAAYYADPTVLPTLTRDSDEGESRLEREKMLWIRGKIEPFLGLEKGLFYPLRFSLQFPYFHRLCIHANWSCFGLLMSANDFFFICSRNTFHVGILTQ